ncbi:MAG TPA: MMPL family transporter [Flavisolibacter sp.]|nr:MMPL family transporter [Flavisolibacter sp.]
MWRSVARVILKYGYVWLAILAIATAFLGWQASKVKLSYEFSRAIPTDNPKYLDYQAFRKQFGEDGNLMVIGIRTKDFFAAGMFGDYVSLSKQIRSVQGVQDVVSVPSAINLVREEETERLQAVPIFSDSILAAGLTDSASRVFLNLPFYRGLLYNPETGAWLMGVRINGQVLNSPGRTKVVNEVVSLAEAFGKKHGLDVHLSGLPLIRTMMADRIQQEMRWFLIGSMLLSALILLIFFRSLSATLLSLAVVIIGVVWSLGVMNLFGYKITLLTALIPPLIVVIGIPNCIYFLNKYHSSYREKGDRTEALLDMISKMGIVTLFCNIAAAIGFAVFALTKSEILKEFGLVAGINIMALFFISLVLIPVALKVLPAPKARHTRYLDNSRLQRWLDRLELWSLNHRKFIYGITAIVLAFSIAGIFRLTSVGYIVDDLPKTDRIYTDLKFFETHFKGVMPLEIVVDTRKKYGVTRNLPNLLKIDSLASYLSSRPYIGKPLTITEGLKFAKQAFFEGDSTYYIMPGDNDLIALRPYLSGNAANAGPQNSFSKLVASFMDSSKQLARISANMKDVGSARLPLILDSVQAEANRLFDTSRYEVRLTGSSVTFLEGSQFIINGLKESIGWAFLLITLCMLYLFRSWRILLCSLLPNIIPLIITGGVMGWAGVPLKPSTVLVFSVALGIAIDITIRFLVNYKQQSGRDADPRKTVVETIHSTGLSIIYTSIVLIAGFVIFCFSGFGGTKALGWLTSLTLITATIANLALLPALIITVYRKKK